MPRGRESPKVVQPNRIHMHQESAQTVNRPTIAGGPQSVPVINWIAPQLTPDAEVIRRNARDRAWMTPFVKKKTLRVRPDIARVRRNEKRQISDQSHAFGVRILLELIGLAE